MRSAQSLPSQAVPMQLRIDGGVTTPPSPPPPPTPPRDAGVTPRMDAGGPGGPTPIRDGGITAPITPRDGGLR
jgi:hypothetical protein